MISLDLNSSPRMIVRYSILSDDTSKNPKDIRRVAEFICSIISVKIYLLPYTECTIVIYTLQRYLNRLQEILNYLEIKNAAFVIMENEEDIAFADSIKNCSVVDRICIRRMLADFRELPESSFRLLLGTDCYFFRVPHEVISYTWNQNHEAKVLYMIDNQTFRGKRYKLRFYRSPILEGLLGDFYCIAPGVSLKRESIMSCLKLIDDWPLYQRWQPDLPKFMKKKVHACEQQAAAMLLGQFPGKALPSSLYNHNLPKNGCVLLHAHQPWLNMALKEIPQDLSDMVKNVWQDLGYTEIIKLTEKLPMSNVQLWKRKIKQML